MYIQLWPHSKRYAIRRSPGTGEPLLSRSLTAGVHKLGVGCWSAGISIPACMHRLRSTTNATASCPISSRTPFGCKLVLIRACARGRGNAAETPLRVRSNHDHKLKRVLLEGTLDAFECGSKRKPEIDGDHVKERHAKIGKLATANDFLS